MFWAACEFASFLILWLGVPFPSSYIRERVAVLLLGFTRWFLPICVGLSSVQHLVRLIGWYKRLRTPALTHKRQDLESIGWEKKD
jgi:hypothetical protein